MKGRNGVLIYVAQVIAVRQEKLRDPVSYKSRDDRGFSIETVKPTNDLLALLAHVNFTEANFFSRP